MKNNIMKECIEFADWLLQKNVIKSKSQNEKEEYHPHEFDLLRGELKINSEELFNEFNSYKLFYSTFMYGECIAKINNDRIKIYNPEDKEYYELRNNIYDK